MKSLSNCSRFALSGDRMVRPVVFPPGRASEGTSPIPSMSSLVATIEKMAYDAEASFRRSSPVFNAEKFVAEQLRLPR
jgi:hypothetical protein